MTIIVDKINERWKEMSTIRRVVAIGCIIVTIGMLVLACVNVDTWFVTVENITFSTGCTEIYRNDILQTEECTEERIIMGNGGAVPSCLAEWANIDTTNNLNFSNE